MRDTFETIEHFHIWFSAGLSLSLGVLFLVMFLKALQRKGRSALLLLPLGLHACLWSSWFQFRYAWAWDNFVMNEERVEVYLSFLGFEKLVGAACLVLALLLIFKSDKPKVEEASDGV